MSRMTCSGFTLYLTIALGGFFVSLLVQKWDHQELIFSALQWIQHQYFLNTTSETSIGLLTLVEQKKKSFSVAVLPSKEVSTETGMIIFIYQFSKN